MNPSRTRFYDLIRPDSNQAQGFIGCVLITLFPLAFLFGVVNRDTIGQLRRRKL